MTVLKEQQNLKQITNLKNHMWFKRLAHVELPTVATSAIVVRFRQNPLIRKDPASRYAENACKALLFAASYRRYCGLTPMSLLSVNRLVYSLIVSRSCSTFSLSSLYSAIFLFFSAVSTQYPARSSDFHLSHSKSALPFEKSHKSCNTLFGRYLHQHGNVVWTHFYPKILISFLWYSSLQNFAVSALSSAWNIFSWYFGTNTIWSLQLYVLFPKGQALC